MEDRAQLHSERRRERRHTLDGAACPAILKLGEHEEIPATIMDVSKSGLRVRVSRTLKPGAEVKIQWGQTEIVGEVRYFKQAAPDQFDVGVRIREATYGNTANATEHLPWGTLTSYLTGRLNAGQNAEAARHLDDCPLCRRQLWAAEEEHFRQKAAGI